MLINIIHKASQPAITTVLNKFFNSIYKHLIILFEYFLNVSRIRNLYFTLLVIVYIRKWNMKVQIEQKDPTKLDLKMGFFGKIILHLFPFPPLGSTLVFFVGTVCRLETTLTSWGEGGPLTLWVSCKRAGIDLLGLKWPILGQNGPKTVKTCKSLRDISEESEVRCTKNFCGGALSLWMSRENCAKRKCKNTELLFAHFPIGTAHFQIELCHVKCVENLVSYWFWRVLWRIFTSNNDSRQKSG